MKRLTCLLALFAVVFPLCACVPQSAEDSVEAMDTYMDFKLYGSSSMYAVETVKSTVKKLDKSLSTTNKKSEIYSLNQNGTAKLGKSALNLLNSSLKLGDEVGGALDVSVYPLVCEWGFISRDYKVPSKSKIKQLLPKVDYKKIKVDNSTVTLSEGMQIDLGSVAKGYAADKCREAIDEEGISSAILNFGGTIAVKGKKPEGGRWKVAITDPDDSSRCFGWLNCTDTVVATSGGYERYFERDGKKYIHILNPKTGCPVDNGVKSVTVISKSGVRADALSTALYVMGVKKAMEFYKAHKDFDFVILTDDNKMYISDSIADSFTLCDGYDYKTVKIQ